MCKNWLWLLPEVISHTLLMMAGFSTLAAVDPSYPESGRQSPEPAVFDRTPLAGVPLPLQAVAMATNNKEAKGPAAITTQSSSTLPLSRESTICSADPVTETPCHDETPGRQSVEVSVLRADSGTIFAAAAGRGLWSIHKGVNDAARQREEP